MTQDELWQKKYQEVKTFIETNHRNPSRHNPEERFKYCNWIKHNKKLLNAGEMKEDRVGLFEKLLEMGRSTGVRIRIASFSLVLGSVVRIGDKYVSWRFSL